MLARTEVPKGNRLLQIIIRGLNGAETNLKTIFDLIGESTTESLIPCYDYICSWMSTTLGEDNDHSFLKKQQIAYFTMNQILDKLPPVLMLSGLADIGSTFQYLGLFVSQGSQSYEKRITQLYNNIISFYSNYFIYRYPSITGTDDDLVISKMPNLLFTYESNNSYQDYLQQHFTRMIFGKYPVATFKRFLKHQNAKIILTQTVISIIKELNYSRTATHYQLLHSFSILFLYIHSFVMAKYVDGQTICDYLRSRPFLSPFCLLAIANHIPQVFYLFNLLLPQELAAGNCSMEDAERIIAKNYPMVDYSNDNSLNDLIAQIPRILLVYFLNIQFPAENISENPQESELITMLHISGAAIYDKMKTLIHYANIGEVTPPVISALSSQLLSCITLSFQRTFIECFTSGMFTYKLSLFFKNVLAIVLPSLGDQIIIRFYDLAKSEPQNGDIIIRGALSYTMTDFYNYADTSLIISYCLQVINEKEITPPVRLFISNFLKSGPPILKNGIEEHLLKCSDICILLDFIHSIESENHCNRGDESEKLRNIRLSLIAKLPFVCDGFPLVITGVNSAKAESPLSSKIVQLVSSVFNNPTPTELINQLRLAGTNGGLVLRVVASSSLIQHSNIANAAVDYACEVFGASYDGNSSTLEAFYISSPMLHLPIAQILLESLIRIGFEDQALRLLQVITPALQRDQMPLHWLSRVLPNISSHLTQRSCVAFASILEGLNIGIPLPQGPERGKTIIMSMVNSMNSKIVDDFQSSGEYRNRYEIMKAIGVCSFILIRTGYEVDELISSVKDLLAYWPDRIKCIKCSAEIACSLSDDMAFKYFINVFNCPDSAFSQAAITTFLILSPLSVFMKIASSSKEIIGGDHLRLKRLMAHVIPSFMRLEGSPDVATRLLSGMLESVNKETPEEVLEQLIDIVGWMYFTLRLQKSRTLLINSSSAFPPKYRMIIATSLDVDASSKFQGRENSEVSGSNDIPTGMFSWN